MEEAHPLPKSLGQEATHSTSAHVSSARASITQKGGVNCVPTKKRNPGFIKELAIAARQNVPSF